MPKHIIMATLVTLVAVSCSGGSAGGRALLEKHHDIVEVIEGGHVSRTADTWVWRRRTESHNALLQRGGNQRPLDANSFAVFYFALRSS